MTIAVYSANSDTLETFADQLKAIGHSVEAFSFLPDQTFQTPHLFCLLLPDASANSIATLKQWRVHLGWHTPVLVFTPQPDPESVRLFLEEGAADVIDVSSETQALQLRLLVAKQRLQRTLTSEERGRLDEKIAQSQRLETLSALSAGLAHDFNNLLAAVVGNTELAMLDVEPDHPARYSLEQIDKSARRAAELARQMLAYSGRSSIEFKPVDLSSLVSEMDELLKASISRRCEIVYELMRPLPLIRGDAVQLRQVVMNLVVNASEASQSTGGAIIVATAAERKGSENLTRLEIRDQGVGMSPEVQSRIFEPFFTTKRVGRGLGMAAVQSIVRSHNGKLELDSAPGQGTTIRLTFPSAKGEPLAAQPSSDDWKGSGTVLIIDDEEAVREAAKRLLRKAGYTVLEANSGKEGIELLDRFSGLINAVILDLNMPGISGQDVLRHIRDTRPTMRVIIWSGFDESRAREQVKGLGEVECIEKPAHVKELAAALKRVLKDLPSTSAQAPQD